jgi:hypothetical protein
MQFFDILSRHLISGCILMLNNYHVKIYFIILMIAYCKSLLNLKN